MECKYAQDLAAFLDGELDAARADSLQAHLEGCPSCRERLSLLKRSYEALDALEAVEVPAGFSRRVAARVRRRFFAPLLAAAAAVLIAAGAVILRFRDSGTVTPVVPVTPAVTTLADLTEEERAVVENLDLLEDYEILADLDLFAQLDMLEGLEEFPEIESI